MVRYTYRVHWSKQVEKSLSKIPRYIRDKFHVWVFLIESQGLEEVRKRSGFHDEPLKGKRVKQFSIRLSKSYRAIYELSQEGNVKVIDIKEVLKHDY